MNALSFITAMPENKVQRARFIDVAISEIENGIYNIREIAPIIDSMEKLLKEMKANQVYRELLSKETDICTISESKKYDFSTCGDVIWDSLDSQIKGLEEQRKEREKFLKSMPQNGVADTEHGNVIMPPSYTATEKITINHRKNDG